MNYFSVCCIAKDEHPYIREWIHHHLLVGAEKIIIFDNESSPSLRISLHEYVQHGLVDLYEIPGKEQQMAAYDCCLKEYEGKSKWIAFIDVDEFLIPKKHSDVRMILADYEEYGGLGVHWVEFGSSGHLARPFGGQMKNYVHRFPLDHPKNMHIKSIVQPGRVKSAWNPHKFIYREPWFCVDENLFPLTGPQGPFTARSIQLNHYYYRSQEYYCQKLDRGRADRADKEGKRRHEAFFPQLTRASILDTWAVRHSEDIETHCPAIESLKQFMDSRQDGADTKKVLFSKILKFLATGKTQSARILIKKLIVSQESRDVIDYLLHKIAQKAGNHAEALSALSRILQRNTECSVCLEYAETLLDRKDYEACDRMLGFVRWKFAAALKTDAKCQARLNDLAKKSEDAGQPETPRADAGPTPPPSRGVCAAAGQACAQ